MHGFNGSFLNFKASGVFGCIGIDGERFLPVSVKAVFGGSFQKSTHASFVIGRDGEDHTPLGCGERGGAIYSVGGFLNELIEACKRRPKRPREQGPGGVPDSPFVRISELNRPNPLKLLNSTCLWSDL